MKIDWINNNLAISGAIDDYNMLDKGGINVVINVRSEQHDDVGELTKRNIKYFWIPITDYAAPRMDQIRTFINLIKKNSDSNILAHCAVGRGRSAMLIGAYLVDTGYTPDEAVEILQKKRPEVLLTGNQYDKLVRYYNER